MLENWKIDFLIQKFLEEDAPFGDITTEILFETSPLIEAEIVAKEDLVLCGSLVAERVFFFTCRAFECKWNFKEGEEVKKGSVLACLRGELKGILLGERLALNLLQHLSGIATCVRIAVKKLKPYKTKLLDTRKTLPGLKLLEKYAVKVGGGQNHRFSLSDGILIKDNHIKAAGGLTKVLKTLKEKSIPHYLKVEVEVSSIEELEKVLEYSPPVDVVLLDNFSPEKVKNALELIKGANSNIKVEVSGGITLENLEDYAKLGVDYISSGSITHSAKAVDISLRVK